MTGSTDEELQSPEGPEEPGAPTADASAETAPPVAQPEEEPEVQRARVHFEEGLRLAEREFWDAAAAEFEVSLRLHPTAPAQLNRAICLQRLFRYSEALAAFERYLEENGDSLSDVRRRGVQRRIDDIRDLLGRVEVFVNVGGASVIVDGRQVGTSPLSSPLMLPSGQHRIEVRLEGYQTVQQTVWASTREPQTVQLNLSPIPRQGLLRVTTNTPGARIVIDDHEVEGPLFEGLVAEGQHRVAVNADGYDERVELVDIAANGQQAITLDALPRRRVHRAWFWSMLGLSITGAVTTAALGATALSLNGSYDETDPYALDDYNRGRALMRGSDAALGITAGAAIATLVLVFFTDWSAARDR